MTHAERINAVFAAARTASVSRSTLVTMLAELWRAIPTREQVQAGKDAGIQDCKTPPLTRREVEYRTFRLLDIELDRQTIVAR